jgi:CRP-like cAMP-binding protein
MKGYDDYLRQFHSIGDADLKLLTDCQKIKSFDKGEMITVPGQVAREFYFVLSGIQMSFFESDRLTHVVAFTYYPSLCAVPESFFSQTPSNCYLTALTPSIMACLSFEQLQELFDRSHSIERLFRKMTEALLTGVVNRHLELQSLTIEERYKSFCKRSPHLLQMVPHKYIASYLGINPTNFSKLYNTVKIG